MQFKLMLRNIFAKTNLLRELRIEKGDCISESNIWTDKKFLHIRQSRVGKKELKVPEKLAKAYTELLSAFEEEKNNSYVSLFRWWF